MELSDAMTLLLGEVGDVPGIDFDGSLYWSIIDKGLYFLGVYLFLFSRDLVFLRLVKVCLAVDFPHFQSQEVIAFSSEILQGFRILYGCHYTRYQLRTSLCWQSFLQRWREQSLGNDFKTSSSDHTPMVKDQNSALYLQLWFSSPPKTNKNQLIIIRTHP